VSTTQAGTELGPETRLHIAKAVDVLVEEFGDHHNRETVERIMDDSVRQLTLRSEGPVVAYSAGSIAGPKLDPGVIEVMAELGIDLSEAYAKPLVSEVVAAADLVVTMGRSVGAVDFPESTKREDWAGRRSDRRARGRSAPRAGRPRRARTGAAR
jgi:hypothetical protein